ncbi:MAG TPA: CoA transferase [Amycolatopsis sp.]|nr:CoA transferase [Amycolatopsis sp.]
MTGALAGVRVVDMTSTVMGPSSTQLLGDHGADVIKVESPAGDTTRHVPPMNSSDMGCAYLQLNRNKRSIVLDLKQQEHMRAMRELLKTADVFVYSIRPNAMARLGLSPEDLAGLNPKLITVSLVGFGEGGPYTGRPVYEDLIQGLTAVPSLLMRTGSPEPHYVPVAFNDRAVGLFAASAMLAALYHKAQTGEAQHIEVPMFESMAQFVLGDHMGGRAFEPPNGPAGYPRTLTPERRPYKTSDGYICAIIYTDTHWRSFGKLVGRPNLLEEDERFTDLRARTVHADATYAFVRSIMPTRTTAEWLQLLNDADVPATPLHTLESIFDDPHLNATGFFERTEHPTEGTLLTVRGPANWSRTPPELRRPAPHRGEHTTEVLQEIGYSEADAQKVATAGRSWTA